MKFLALLGGALLAGTWAALAQVSVEVVFDYDQYLANEPLRAGVRIANFSGQTLKLGEDPEWLDLNVETEQGFLVSRTSDPPVVEAFELPSSSRATRWVDLVPYFNIGKAGRYKIQATVRFRDLGMDVSSKPAPITITSGAKIWEQDFGLRDQAGDGSASLEVRRYALIQAMNAKRVSLYCRLSDTQEARVFRVLYLGPVLTFTHPEAQVDRAGHLHVLFQTSARHFNYSVVAPDGELTVRQNHQYTDRRPMLRATDAGNVAVAGGTRMVTPSDIPKPEPLPITEAEKSLAPKPTAPASPTNAPAGSAPAPATPATRSGPSTK